MQVRYEKVGRTGKNRFTGERREPIDKAYYICQTYNRLGKNACTSHKIEARDLYNLVLKDIQELASMFRDMLGGIRFNQKRGNLARMDTSMPVLFIAGQDDPVGNMGKGVRRSYDAFRAAGMQDVSIQLYPGLRHEILNEKAMQETVYNDILNWLSRYI